MKKSVFIVIIIGCAISVFKNSITNAAEWINMAGTVKNEQGVPLCAMVLANGQFMFSCGDNEGRYDIEVPLDAEGKITIYSFCDSFAPFKRVTESWEAKSLDIIMHPAFSDMSMTVTAEWIHLKSGWLKLSGTVSYNGTPLCAMVLANGQHQFTCTEKGEYSLEVPLDEKGEITLFAFCDGFQPYKKVLETNYAKPLDIVEYINEVRTEGSWCGTQYYPPVSSVVWNDKLSNAAMSHSKDMAEHNFLSHTGSDGTSFGDRIKKEGYHWTACGENWGFGYNSTSDAVRGWLESPGHCANIMNPKFTEVGAAWVTGQYNSQNSLYWTLDLADRYNDEDDALELTDWVNRGTSFNCVADPSQSLVFVEMDRSEEHDLSVFDYSDPTNIIYLGTVKGFGNVVTRYKDYLVSIRSDTGLNFWDVSQPLNPVSVYQSESVRPIYGKTILGGIYFAGDYLFCLDGYYLRSYNISDLSNISLVSSVSTHPHRYLCGVIVNSYLICIQQDTGTYNMSVFDISVPADMKEVKNMVFTSNALAHYGGGSSMAILQDKYLLVSNRGEDKIHVIDISNINNPVYLMAYTESELDMYSITNIDRFHFLGIHNSPSGARIYTVSETGTISPLSELIGLDWSIYGYVADNFAFITGWNTDLTLLNITDKTSPFVTDKSEINLELRDLAVDDNYVYIITGDFIKGWFERHLIVRKLNNDGILEEPVSIRDGIYKIAAENNKVVAVGASLFFYERDENGIHNLLGKKEVSANAYTTVDISGNLINVGDHYYDCSNPDNIHLIGSLKCGQDTVLFSHYAACRDEDYNVSIYDLTHPTGLMLIESLALGDGDMKAFGDTLFINGTQNLRIVQPIADGGFSISEYQDFTDYADWNISADENRMILWYGDEAKIYNYDNTASPYLVGNSHIPFNGCHGGWYGFLSGNYFYTIDAFAGVNVLRIKQ